MFVAVLFLLVFLFSCPASAGDFDLEAEWERRCVLAIGASAEPKWTELLLSKEALDRLDASRSNPEAPVIAAELMAQIRHVASAGLLTDQERFVLERRLDGYTFEEIGALAKPRPYTTANAQHYYARTLHKLKQFEHEREEAALHFPAEQQRFADWVAREMAAREWDDHHLVSRGVIPRQYMRLYRRAFSNAPEDLPIRQYMTGLLAKGFNSNPVGAVAAPPLSRSRPAEGESFNQWVKREMDARNWDFESLRSLGVYRAEVEALEKVLAGVPSEQIKPSVWLSLVVKLEKHFGAHRPGDADGIRLKGETEAAWLQRELRERGYPVTLGPNSPFWTDAKSVTPTWRMQVEACARGERTQPLNPELRNRLIEFFYDNPPRVSASEP